MIYLKLTAPFNPGSYDEGATYPHAFISIFNMNTISQVIEIRWEYGNFDPSVGWVTGKASVTQIAHIQNEEFYAAIAAKADPSSDDSVLMSAARQAYNYLVTKGLVDGTVTESIVEAQPAPAADADTATDTAPAADADTATDTAPAADADTATDTAPAADAGATAEG